MTSMPKYRSKLEARVAGFLGEGWEYEPTRLSYFLPKMYMPDFVLDDGYAVTYIEVKGYFRAGDTAKYKAVAKECEKRDIQFIMLFQKPHAPIRKGSKTTYAKWAEKNGIAWESTDRAWMFAKETEL